MERKLIDLDEVLSEQERTFEGPGWKAHVMTIGKIAFYIAGFLLLLYLLNRSFVAVV